MRAERAMELLPRTRGRTPRVAAPAPSRRGSPGTCLEPRQLNRLARLPGGPLLILKGDCLARHGHPFYDLYAVYSGLIEARVTNAAGHVRVLGQYRPGDVIGLDALRRGNYPADFLALEHTTLCVIPLALMDDYLAQPATRH